MRPLISIVTPSFNSEKTIEECIQSIKKHADADIEHIVIDGCSTDNTISILKSHENAYRLRWISEKDNGIADAMNKGFRMSQGLFIAWIDADNYYNAEILKTIIEKIKTDEADIYCGYVEIVDKGTVTKVHKPVFPFSFKKSLTMSTSGIPVQPGVFFKKKLFDTVGGFDTTYRVAGDYDFWVKVLKLQPKISYIEKTFGFYRKEDTGASQSLKGIWNGYKEMLKIGSKHGQTFYGKILLTLKYTKGYVSACKQILLKK